MVSGLLCGYCRTYDGDGDDGTRNGTEAAREQGTREARDEAGGENEVGWEDGNGKRPPSSYHH